MASASVAKVLGDSAELAALRERLDLINRLQRRYRNIAPGELASASRVCAIDGTTIVLRASSGPVAAALRQVAPRLYSRLVESNSLKQNEKENLTGLRIEVQVEPAPVRRTVRGRQPIPFERLAVLAEAMAEGPLKETLERISRDQVKKSREKT
ncbi:hypothetical protein BWI17_01365 [Betaproteobacteria bacterium GR16-43]|nr:hypothetical protein BWI17_01365 [Betaproteobacteria bacterium GR16-43]